MAAPAEQLMSTRAVLAGPTIACCHPLSSLCWAPCCPLTITASPLPPLPLQAVELFIQERIHYLDIVRLAEECCEAHRKELVEAPSLEEIVHYDQ